MPWAAHSSGGNEPDARSVFEILVREHADMLEAFLRSLMGPDPGLDDVFQEVMLVAWRRLADYDKSRPFGPWLRGIAQMLVLQHARQGRVRPRSTDPAVLVELESRFETLLHQPGDTFKERAERILQCLAQLPDTLREAIELVYIRDTPMSAAAEVTGANREAFWKRVQRGRQLLADCMGVGKVIP